MSPTSSKVLFPQHFLCSLYQKTNKKGGWWSSRTQMCCGQIKGHRWYLVECPVCLQDKDTLSVGNFEVALVNKCIRKFILIWLKNHLQYNFLNNENTKLDLHIQKDKTDKSSNLKLNSPRQVSTTKTTLGALDREKGFQDFYWLWLTLQLQWQNRFFHQVAIVTNNIQLHSGSDFTPPPQTHYIIFYTIY